MRWPFNHGKVAAALAGQAQCGVLAHQPDMASAAGLADAAASGVAGGRLFIASTRMRSCMYFNIIGTENVI
jgi:hypothetical protein